MYVVNGSDGRCIVAVRLIAGVRYLERPLKGGSTVFNSNDIHALTYYCLIIACTYFSDKASHC